MGAISTNKAIRREQFRATAKRILQRAEGAWGTNDRIGQLARAMEHAYAAGACDRDRPEDPAVEDGVVRWDAIPSRSRQVLERIGFRVRRYERELRAGEAFAVFQGVADTAPRGAKASFALWVDADEPGLLRPMDTQGGELECAASSVSGLMRLGILTRMRTDTPAVRPAALSTLGIDTILRAIADGHIYAPVW